MMQPAVVIVMVNGFAWSQLSAAYKCLYRFFEVALKEEREEKETAM